MITNTYIYDLSNKILKELEILADIYIINRLRGEESTGETLIKKWYPDPDTVQNNVIILSLVHIITGGGLENDTYCKHIILHECAHIVSYDRYNEDCGHDKRFRIVEKEFHARYSMVPIYQNDNDTYCSIIRNMDGDVIWLDEQYIPNI